MAVIGPKVLSQEMATCVFHYWDEIYGAIENIRSAAAESHKEFNQKLRDNPSDAVSQARGDNTISILGSRGSGKTSVIMTLQDKLRNNNGGREEHREPYNIVMPFLVPQDIEKEQPLLGWIIGQLLKESEKIDERSWDEEGNLWEAWGKNAPRNGVLSNPFRKCQDDLLRAFSLRSKAVLPASPPSFDDQAYSYMEAVRQDADLLVNLLRLVSMMMDYYRDKARRENGTFNGCLEPLLFFTIDDLDLSPTRSSEVLDLVLRFLQHPNIVVICGWNQELFQNHLSMELLRTQGVLDSNHLDTSFGFDDVFMERYRTRTTALVSARRLALDNLKKAFPPARRFEIRGLTLRERASFPYAPKRESEKPLKGKMTSNPASELKVPIAYVRRGGMDIPVYDEAPPEKAVKIAEDTNLSLFDLIAETILICSHVPNQKSGKTFNPTEFLYDEQDKPLQIYMRIFDNKARGLINIYQAFESLRKRQEELESEFSLPPGSPGWKDSEDITDEIKALFDTILSSNTRFAPYRRGIRDLVQIQSVRVSRDRTKASLNHYCSFRAIQRTFERYNLYKSDKEEAENSGLYPVDAAYEVERKYDYFPEMLVDVFLLLNFMENFLYSISQSRKRIHGGREFSELLNWLHPPLDFVERRPQNQLLMDAILSGGIAKVTLFPDTNNFELSVSILNAYEQEIFEGSQSHYHFTGFNTLRQFFRLIKNLLSESGENASQKVQTQKVQTVARADAGWLAAIINLFASLLPYSTNVERLAVYTVFLEITRGDSVAALSAVHSFQHHRDDDKMSLANVARALRKNSGKKVQSNLNQFIAYLKSDKATAHQWDRELDLIVDCLHLNDEIVREFRAWWERYFTTEPKDTELSAQLSVANVIPDSNENQVLYEQVNGYAETTGTSFDIDVDHDALEDFRNRLEQIKAGEISSTVSHFPDLPRQIRHALSENTEVQPTGARVPIQGTIEDCLLFLLKWKLALACAESYEQRHSTLQIRYQHLLRSAAAIRNYADHWNLTPKKWGELQIRSGEALKSIFRRSGTDDLIENLDDILNMGPFLEEHGNEEYSTMLATFRQYISDRSSDFPSGAMTQVLYHLGILAEAAVRIRRRTRLEEKIYSAIVEVGQMVAEEFAKVSEELYEDTDTRSMVWPVSARYDEEMGSLEKFFQELLPGQNLHAETARPSSRFDVKYSTLELYLQEEGRTTGGRR